MTAEDLIAIGLSNALAATLLALIALAVSRLTRNAPLSHALWALVLLKLVTPPLFEIRLPGGAGHPAARAPAEPATFAAVFPAPEEIAPAPEPRAEEQDGARLEPPAAVPEELARIPVTAAAPVLPAALVPATPAGAPEPAVASLSLPRAAPLAAAVWLSGSVLWFALALSRILRFRRLLVRARPAPEALLEEARLVARSLGLERVPDVVVVAARVSPHVWALGTRARLVIPEELAGSLTPPGLKTLIAHEIAHIVRRDHWIRWVEMAALGLYWWLPVAWWARRGLRAAEEECCDAWVQWAFPEERREYARTILHTVEFLSPGSPAVPEGASGMARVSILERRFRMILHGRSTRRLPGSCRAALVVLAALVLPWAAGFTAAEDPEGPSGITERKIADDELPQSSAPSNEIRIWLAWDAKTKTTLRRTGKDQLLTLEELAADIAGAQADSRKGGKEDFRVIIEAAHDVPFEDVVAVLEMGKRHGAAVELAAEGSDANGASKPSRRLRSKLPGGQVVTVTDNVVSVSDPETKKTLWKTAVGSKIVSIEPDEKGKTLILRGPDQTIAIDLATGKTLKLKSAGSGDYGGAAPLKVPVSPVGAGLNVPGTAAGSPVDVVQLGSALIEARGAVQLAENRLHRISQATAKGLAGEHDLRAEEIELETAKRKIDLFQRITRSTLKGTMVEIETLKRAEELARQRYEAGQATEDAFLALAVRRAHAVTLVELLEELLR
jgi:beta-lactamase regulating signal transducer with metallopeptidase domain